MKCQECGAILWAHEYEICDTCAAEMEWQTDKAAMDYGEST